MSGRPALRPLPPDFYARAADEVARDLLGAVLVSTVGGALVSGRIVETEAYLGPHDPASHAAERIGRTARNAAMFGPPGIAYVYRIYGLHWCLNAVTGEEGYPAAVLIRALEPLHGIEVMRRRRRRGRAPAGNAGVRPERELTAGPARLAEALAIDGSLNGHPLQDPPLVLAAGEPVHPAEVEAAPRIGVTRAADWPLRFFIRGNPWVSR
ncbi:MAG: DNA-3-methyladenine glycosylase [bacterium]|nr:MAG: DNA-3-methyladenine glycosylase [bacterium]